MNISVCCHLYVAVLHSLRYLRCYGYDGEVAVFEMFILIYFFNSGFVITNMAKRKQPSVAAFGFTSKEAKESKNDNVNRTTFSWPAESGVRVEFDSSTPRERPADAEPEEASTTATAAGVVTHSSNRVIFIAIDRIRAAAPVNRESACDIFSSRMCTEK